MKKRELFTGLGLLGAFILWTAAICLIDLKPIGPQRSIVGFATINGWFHRLTGLHLWLYTLTDWLGLVPVAVCVAFALLGLHQWIRRRAIREVDADILLLGGVYAVTIAAYLLFESVVVNYRPILIEGRLEASYPSSTTLLTLCVMSTAWIQLRRRMRHGVWRRVMLCIVALFTAFMVVGRLLSGVHWLTDIIGGILLSIALVAWYRCFEKK